jgi:hypothetical protein
MPSTYRCSPCGHSYPHHIDFRICPVCKLSCWIDYAGVPMDEDDARQIANEAEFERYYAAHEERKLAAAVAEIADLPETAEPRPTGLRMRWGV